MPRKAPIDWAPCKVDTQGEQGVEGKRILGEGQGQRGEREYVRQGGENSY